MNRKLALITGADGKIGGACANLLASSGVDLVLVGKNLANLEELDDQIKPILAGNQVTLVPVDLITQPEIVNGLGAALIQRFGKLDLLFSFAGQPSLSSPLAHMNPDFFSEAMSVNLLVHQRVIASLNQALMASSEALAFFLSSPEAVDSRAFRADLAAAWAGLEAMVRSWSQEVSQAKLRTFVLRLPPIATPFRAATHPGENQATLPTPQATAKAILQVVKDIEQGHPPNSICVNLHP